MENEINTDEEKVTKTQWEKRVNVFQYIYSLIVINDFDRNISKAAYESEDFDVDQLKTIEYFINNRQEIITKISDNLNPNWTYDRISGVDKALLITAYAEYKALGTHKNILIDQTLITAKRYTELQSTGYINAILDKILVTDEKQE
jgi:N utilization substance protein B